MTQSITPPLQTFEEALKLASKKNLSESDRVLLLLTETVTPHFEEEQPFYTYTDIDGRLVFPLGKNEQGQRQFLISINPRFAHYPHHPETEVMKGWHWTLYGEVNPQPTEQEEKDKSQPIVIVLTALEPAEGNGGKGERKAMISQKVNPLDPLPGFSLASLGVFEGHRQYVIVIQSDKFRVQLSQN